MFSENGKIILEKRYLRRDAEGKLIETPDQMLHRVAKAISDNELKEVRAKWNEVFYNMMASLKFLPNSPTLMNAGTGAGTLSGCFVVPIDDTMSSLLEPEKFGIMEAVRAAAVIQKFGGGCGFSLSRLRGRGNLIKSTHGKACISGSARIPCSESVLRFHDIKAPNEEVMVAGNTVGVKKFHDNGTKNTVILTTENGYSLGATSDHEMMVLRDDGTFKKVPISKLHPGDAVSLMRNNWPSFEQQRSIQYEPVKDEYSTRRKKVTIPRIFGPSFAYLLGLFFADGSFIPGQRTPRGIVFHLNGLVDEDVRKAVDYRMEGMFGIKPVWKPRKNRLDGFVYSSAIAAVFLQNGASREDMANLTVPEVIWKSGRQVASSFVCGFFDGDGHIDGRKICATSISKELLSDIHLMLLLLGIPGRLQPHGTARKGHQDSWRLVLSGTKDFFHEIRKVFSKSIKIVNYEEPLKQEKFSLHAKLIRAISNKDTRGGVANLVGTSTVYSQETTSRTTLRRILDTNVISDEESYRLRFILDFIVTDKVTSIEAYGADYVFDLTVDNSAHAYCANGFYVSNCGPIAVMRELNETANLVTQGGKRNGANMGILRVDHPDIMDFISAKKKHGVLPNFNISVGVTDTFMQAVLDGDSFWMKDPRTGKKTHELDAKELYGEIIRLMHSNGEPGIIFIDSMNKSNPTPHLGDIESTNPCGEQPLLPFESCNLGSINLFKFAHEGEVAYEDLGQTVRDAVRFLDNVIDVNDYPMTEIKNLTLQTRKIGLGVMGFADMLSTLDIQYDSPKGIQTGREVMGFIQECARQYSEELATEKGPFPAYKKNSVVKKPRRNATLTTIAPTGSLSKIAGCSASIEPHFGIAFSANILDGQTLMFTTASLPTMITVTEDLMAKIIENGGKLTDIKDIPKKVQKVFPIATDVKTEWHLQMQAAFQEHTDNAVSKTVNLPYTATVDEMKNIITNAYSMGCKGLTVYRIGSRPEQVIVLPNGEMILAEDRYIKPRRRPKETRGVTEEFNVGSCGNIYVTLGFDPETNEPVELFATNASDDGGCQSLLDSNSRLCSIMLRADFDPKYIASKLKVQACHACGNGGNANVKNCADAMREMLERHLHLEKEGQKMGPKRPRNAVDMCPVCNEGVLIRKSANCKVCPACGHDFCGG